MVPTMVVAFFHDTVVEWCRHRVVLLFSQEMKIKLWCGFAKYISWHVRYNREKKHTHTDGEAKRQRWREKEKGRDIRGKVMIKIKVGRNMVEKGVSV